VAFTLPPNLTAEQVTSIDSLSGLAGITELEAAQPEGQRMLVGITFQWRFPFFEWAAGLVNLMLKGSIPFPVTEDVPYQYQNQYIQLTPWPEFTDIVFVDPTEPVWYIAWVKTSPWWQAILAAMAGTFATYVGIAFLVLFLGAVVWRVLPQEIKQPIQEVLNALPNLVILAVMVMIFTMLPGLMKER